MSPSAYHPTCYLYVLCLLSLHRVKFQPFFFFVVKTSGEMEKLISEAMFWGCKGLSKGLCVTLNVSFPTLHWSYLPEVQPGKKKGCVWESLGTMWPFPYWDFPRDSVIPLLRPLLVPSFILGFSFPLKICPYSPFTLVSVSTILMSFTLWAFLTLFSLFIFQLPTRSVSLPHTQLLCHESEVQGLFNSHGWF